MTRSIGYGHKCRECYYFSKTTRPGCRKGWCNRPGQPFGKEDVAPSDDACNMFKSK